MTQGTGRRNKNEGIKVAHFNPIGVVHLKAIEDDTRRTMDG